MRIPVAQFGLSFFGFIGSHMMRNAASFSFFFSIEIKAKSIIFWDFGVVARSELDSFLDISVNFVHPILVFIAFSFLYQLVG